MKSCQEANIKSWLQVLLELIQTKLNYVVQEAIVVIKDIFRRYPNKCALTRSVCGKSACQHASQLAIVWPHLSRAIRAFSTEAQTGQSQAQHTLKLRPCTHPTNPQTPHLRT